MIDNRDYTGKMPSTVATGLLWLLTVVLGALCIVYGHDLLVEAILALTGALENEDTVQMRGVVQTVFNCTFIGAWMVWLAVVMGGAEYHFRRVGKPRSRRILRITLAAELFILAVVLLVRLL